MFFGTPASVVTEGVRRYRVPVLFLYSTNMSRFSTGSTLTFIELSVGRPSSAVAMPCEGLPVLEVEVTYVPVLRAA